MSGEASTSTRILFVDDSKVMLKTASKILSAEFDVVTAVDGDDAWEKLGRDHDIQVMFTDINMPNLDGYGLLKNVRTADDPGLSAMPVILVTGADDDEAARQTALDRGATDFLNKKHLSSELLPRARAHAKYQRISRQLQAQSTLDPMTGMANEHGFLDRLEQDIAHARRHRHELGVMRVEIDGLVALYERYGNRVVEPIVLHVANMIRARIRKEDTAAHIGLGGFAISAPDGQLRGLEVMAAWLHDEAEALELEIDGQRLSISLSTAVIGDDSQAWTSAKDALARCQAALEDGRRLAAEQVARDRARRKAEEQAALEQSRRQAEEQAAFERARQQAEEWATNERSRQQVEEQAAREQARRQAEEQATRERERSRHQAEEQVARERARQQADAKAAREAAERQAQARQQQATSRQARRGSRKPEKASVERGGLPLLQRLKSFLRLQGARLAAFFRNLGGK